MKTLEQIKNEYVMDKFLSSHELDTWIDFQNYFASRHPEWFEQHSDEVAKIYATECAKESLRLASEGLIEWSYEIYPNFGAAREAILSENNLPKHK